MERMTVRRSGAVWDDLLVNDPQVYVATYGWNRRNVLIAVFGAFMVAFAVGSQLIRHRSPLWQAILIGLFGLLALALPVMTSVSRRVALRADDTGLLLVRSWFKPDTSKFWAPWSDLEAIVLWRQFLPRGSSMPYVGMRLRAGAAPPVRKSMGAAGRAISDALVPDVAPELVQLSIGINMWRLDIERLAAAVGAFAPWVTIEAHSTWR